MLAAEIRREINSDLAQLTFMCIALVVSFLACSYVTYKAAAANTGKLNLICILFTFVPFLLLDGIGLGIFIGNNHTETTPRIVGSGHPDHKNNNDLILLKKLPTV